jgi:hypothetical protein
MKNSAKTSSRTKAIKPGDIFAIPLSPTLFAVGIALHMSRRFRNGMLTGYFNVCYTSLEAIRVDELEPDFIFIPNYTSVKLVQEGDWPLVGHNSQLLEQIEIPVLVSVTTLYRRDEIVGQLKSVQDVHSYERLEGQGQVFVENKLRSHFESKNCKTEE